MTGWTKYEFLANSSSNSGFFAAGARALSVSHLFYFFFRRILFQIRGIQSVSALPGDPTLNQFDNKYDVASYKKTCAEFGIDPSSDFRYTEAANHGLGSVYIYATGLGLNKTSDDYPGSNKFSD